MSSPAEQEIRFLKESLPELQPYLLSRELYWPLGGNLPRLTIGNLLLSLRKLQALDQSAWGQFTPTIERTRQQWQTAWKQKTARETANRLRLWQDFMSELRMDPKAHAHTYVSEARGRVIIQLLLADLPDAPERESLSGLDAILRSLLRPGPFLWQNELQPAFPESEFWFLYGSF